MAMKDILCDDENEMIEKLKEEKLKNGFKTVKQLLQEKEKWLKLSTGCPDIDKILKGGFPIRGITQLSGESATGKTQFCLQLCLMVQYPVEMGGLNSGAFYIYTEDAFPSKRLQELCYYHSTKISSSKKIQFANNIIIEKVLDNNQLDVCLHTRLPQLLSKKKIGLIIIDSVAGIFRFDYENDQMIERANDMNRFAAKLKQISLTHNIAIVCVNQVTTDLSSTDPGLIPALGLTWENNVTTHFSLARNSQLSEKITREFKIVKSSGLPCESCYFSIDQEGVKPLNV